MGKTKNLQNKQKPTNNKQTRKNIPCKGKNYSFLKKPDQK